ncbi:YeaH/YhbH family protein [Pleionea sp. CnH1-48]|uniref:YeaH/YhbH family protein n=1 Tax=Pleionea sp. CnH1-48 TaxID=2954494 RepID=UPI00209866D5|nr:YeaH/YhbH family protein [Pleionea sp. CnH1-48]MCO7225417.1 YeaH/YhbH family protein [Pleionea sp. CnH1-48]
MAQLIDRRQNAKNKSTVNRQRFIRRYKKQIKKAIADQIGKRSVTDIEKGENISIPSKDIGEPTFGHTSGGKKERIYPGNKEFTKGDRIKRPPPGGGQGGGGKASDQGEGEDDFMFEISKDEYLDILFDDLELPNLQKNQLKKMTKTKTVRAGFTTNGVPANINIVRSLRAALSRRIALSADSRRERSELKEELERLEADGSATPEEITKLKIRIEELDERIQRVPFIDTFDLRFNNFTQRPDPTSQAVMFCIMDVSGSMDQATKDMAKRFFILLYLFLSKSYKDVEVVFIRHHTQAKEVDEQEFFYSQETGGTIVSSALKLTKEIIAERYPSNEWNIYAAQASDGDNWNDDSPLCYKLLDRDILPLIRYFAYVEITQRDHQSLWEQYLKIAETHENFALQHIKSQSDIYPVFREFFRKQAA